MKNFIYNKYKENIDEYHKIKPIEFEQEGYFLVICSQVEYSEIAERMIEIWKVYKTEKYYHVLEFEKAIFQETFN